MNRRAPWVVTAFSLPTILALVVLLYFPTLSNEFVWDDETDIVQNPAIRSLTRPQELLAARSNHSRPAVNASFAVDHAIWGEQATGFHLTNLLLHLVNVLLFFYLARWLLSSRGAAALATFWFALFPLNAEAINSISLGRSYLLVGTFSLVAMVALIRGIDRVSPGWFGVVVLALLGAAATSEWAMMLPIMLISIGVVAIRSGGIRETGPEQISHARPGLNGWSGRRAWWISSAIAAGFFVVGAIWIGTRVDWVGAGLADRGLVESGLSAAVLLPLVKSVQLLFSPFPVNLWYSVLPFGAEQVTMPLVWGCWGLIILTGGIVGWLCRRGLIEGWLALVVACVLVPVVARLILFPNPPHPLAARWFYLPAMAWALLVAAIGMRLWHRVGVGGRWIATMIVGTALVAASIAVWNRSFDWRSDRTLWLATAVLTPDSSWAHLNLGVDYLKSRQNEAAREELQAALAIDPHYGKAYDHLGETDERLGRTDEAATAYRRAIEEMPGALHPYLALSNLYVRRQDWPEAVPVLERVLAIDPTVMEARLDLAVSYQELGEMERAISLYREVMRGPAPPPPIYYNLALALAQTGRLDEAISMYEQFLAVAPPALSLHRQRAEQQISALRRH